MAGRIDCCRYEATLDDLLDDDVMAPVLRSAGLDAQGFREMIAATARRIDDGRSDDDLEDDRVDGRAERDG